MKLIKQLRQRFFGYTQKEADQSQLEYALKYSQDQKKQDERVFKAYDFFLVEKQKPEFTQKSVYYQNLVNRCLAELEAKIKLESRKLSKLF